MSRTLDSRELGEVIHNRFRCVDIVVDERFAFLGTSFTEDGHTSEAETSREDHLPSPVCVVLDFFLG